MAKQALTHEYLLSILRYDKESGSFVRKVRRGGHKIGTIAGAVDDEGYIEIRINGKRYPASRLAWFYVHGEWPVKTIDHKDRNKTNNSFSNLREADHASQNRNRNKIKNCSSIYKGVSKIGNRWRAQITLENSKPKHLGSFTTEEEAYAAYCKAAKEHFGEFACLG